MIHPEHVNRARRQLIRDSPNNPTPIAIREYYGSRATKLPALLLGLMPEPQEPAELAVRTQQIFTQSLNPQTYLVRVQQNTVGVAFHFPLGPLTGIYKLTYIKIELLGAAVFPVTWYLVKNDSRPITFQDAQAGEILLPYRPHAGFMFSLYQESAEQSYCPLAVRDAYNLDYLSLLFGQGPAPGVDNFLQVTLTAEQL